jgi:hypothetical protein
MVVKPPRIAMIGIAMIATIVDNLRDIFPPTVWVAYIRLPDGPGWLSASRNAAAEAENTE